MEETLQPKLKDMSKTEGSTLRFKNTTPDYFTSCLTKGSKNPKSVPSGWSPRQVQELKDRTSVSYFPPTAAVSRKRGPEHLQTPSVKRTCESPAGCPKIMEFKQADSMVYVSPCGDAIVFPLEFVRMMNSMIRTRPLLSTSPIVVLPPTFANQTIAKSRENENTLDKSAPVPRIPPLPSPLKPTVTDVS